MAGFAFRSLPFNGEHQAGIGFVTLAVVLIGLHRSRARDSVRITAIAAAAIVVTTTAYTDWVVDPVTFWRPVFDYFPGAQAIRAVVRISILLTIPAAIGVALFVQNQRFRPLVLLIIVPVILAEQVRTSGTYEKAEAQRRVEHLAARIPSECSAFYYAPDARDALTAGVGAPVFHIDAMWAGLHARRPTVNGYSGNEPPMYDGLGVSVHHSDEARTALVRAIHEWGAVNNLEGLCLVH